MLCLSARLSSAHGVTEQLMTTDAVAPTYAFLFHRHQPRQSRHRRRPEHKAHQKYCVGAWTLIPCPRLPDRKTQAARERFVTAALTGSPYTAFDGRAWGRLELRAGGKALSVGGEVKVAGKDEQEMAEADVLAIETSGSDSCGFVPLLEEGWERRGNAMAHAVCSSPASLDSRSGIIVDRDGNPGRSPLMVLLLPLCWVRAEAYKEGSQQFRWSCRKALQSPLEAQHCYWQWQHLARRSCSRLTLSRSRDGMRILRSVDTGLLRPKLRPLQNQACSCPYELNAGAARQGSGLSAGR